MIYLLVFSLGVFIGYAVPMQHRALKSARLIDQDLDLRGKINGIWGVRDGRNDLVWIGFVDANNGH